jgi:hypothetical protein
MESNYHEEELYKVAKKRIKEIKGFYIHLMAYILVNLFLLFINKKIFHGNIINFELQDLSLMFFWGIGLFAHWVGTFGTHFFLGKNWEERKIKELMDKDRKMRNKWE